MGTNYYILDDENTHICKLSAGKAPIFKIQEGKFKNEKELAHYLIGWLVKDEYGDWYNDQEFWVMLKRHWKANPKGAKWVNEEFC